ncbi:acyltransferase [Arsenicicoccus piscis]|uniref:Acyltransferase 3 domain-containing protein n=1 Tax=Arsenicicoccus piscis TaxID=673954 RepID=A0ABQ6HPX3_9MICO|nr:acyltransferase [Arsenicicoccus piscis]MCH8628832.1 acyltransferase [Arsenicicoccus piscis]GMA20118.1 hypothetical protein GCM10025862_21390 [Arsenicicoccus piscis]
MGDSTNDLTAARPFEGPADRAADGSAGSSGSRPPTLERSTEASRRAERAFLPEIQALRMWAVGLVVVFHLWPFRYFTGGYIGVDAFFVISGFLITGHLVREVERTGRVRLGAFYARRVRRLLPMSLSLLLLLVPVSMAILPREVWDDVAREIVASTFYVQNIWLAHLVTSPDNVGDTLVQHYWSLSTEEQFYLVWPALVLLGVALASRLRPFRPVRTIGFVLLTVTVLSFAFSLYAQVRFPAEQYFLTPTRAWEFASGGLLVLGLRRFAPGPRLSLVLRWGGLALLLVGSWVLVQGDPFPGWRALVPVVATGAVIAAGDCHGRDRLGYAFTAPVVQWLGRISYSIYLWHWPIIFLLPFVLGHDLTLAWKAICVVLILVLAHLSQKYVEDATRFVPRLRASTRLTLLSALGAMLVVSAAAAVEFLLAT